MKDAWNQQRVCNCDPFILTWSSSPKVSEAPNMITGFFKKKPKTENTPEPTSPLQKRAGKTKRRFSYLTFDPSFY